MRPCGAPAGSRTGDNFVNDQIATIFIGFLWVLIILIIARSLMSWFPQAANNQFGRLIYQATEPLLEPVRKIMPRTGMIDLTPMIVIVVLYVMIYVVQQAAEA